VHPTGSRKQAGSKKTSDRMATATVLHQSPPAKAKPLQTGENAAVRRIAFPRGFQLNQSVVPADGEVTSQSAIGGNAYHAPAAFTTTHWSVVLEAQGESPRHMRHLKSSAGFIGGPFTALCGDKGAGPEEAQDLTQGFFCSFVGAPGPADCAQREGAITFLSAHGAEALSGRRTPPRDGDQTWQRPAAHSVGRTAYEERSGMEPADPLTAERIYERRWASTCWIAC
jgi:hypothetical protein